jgi:cobalt/nickel transport system permease protein
MRSQETERRGMSPIHRLPTRVKLLATLAVVTLIVMLPREVGQLYWIPAALLGGVWATSRMPVVFALRRLAVAQLFIVGVALLLLLSASGPKLFLGTVAKSNLCVLAMILLTWATPFQEILQELRRLRLPGVMITTLALMYRYLPVLAEESRRMQRARASRTFCRSRRMLWQSLSVIGGQLFIRSAERAERIYLAMCARGWK